MKPLKEIPLVKVSILALLGLMCLIPACLTKTPVVTQATVPQITMQPQIVPMPVVTPTQVIGPNGVPSIVNITNIVNQTNMVGATNWVTVLQTNGYTYAANTQQVQSVAGTIQTVNAVSGPINPYSGIVSTVVPWGASAVLAFSTWLAAYKNKQKAGMLTSIIQGVESAAPVGGNDATPVTVAAVKASVAKSAALNGNTALVHATVQANT
jgi:hypothetical protein